MHPVLTGARVLLGYLAASLLVGMLVAAALGTLGLAAWRPALLMAVPLSLAYAFILPSAWYVCRSLPIARRRLLPGLSVFAGASLVAGASLLALSLLWQGLMLSLGETWAATALSAHQAITLWGIGSGIYLLSLLLHDLALALQNVRQAQHHEAQSQTLVREAELQALRAQINPHFLFNCLNSISALTSSDASAARGMTIALAQYFRQTLALSEQRHISVAQELAHCQCFLDIEKVRFGDKLIVAIALDETAARGQLAPMLLQPLVENAVKHGIAASLTGGVVRIRGMVRGNWLHLMVENPLTKGSAPANGTGTGLKNVRQRLTNLYGDQARLSTRQTTDTFVVELTLPWRHQSRDSNLDR